MGQPRCNQISLEVTPYYHVISRCVRRQFLCGADPLTGQDYSHRRTWIQRRLSQLVDAFAIDLCAYAVMSNHYHLVLRVDQSAARSWSAVEVLRRWLRVFQGPSWMHEVIRDDCSKGISEAMRFVIEAYRSRLMSISWFMRCMNEPIARRANREDGVTGHFWQGRYRLQALADEGALLAAMAYVDLNPLRASIVDRPEAAADCSAKQRFGTFGATTNGGAPSPPILSFDGCGSRSAMQGLPGDHLEYLQLLDWSGRVISRPGVGTIARDIPAVAERLGFAPAEFMAFAAGRNRYRQSVLGHTDRLATLASRFGRGYVRGYRKAGSLFATASRAFFNEKGLNAGQIQGSPAAT